MQFARAVFWTYCSFPAPTGRPAVQPPEGGASELQRVSQEVLPPQQRRTGVSPEDGDKNGVDERQTVRGRVPDLNFTFPDVAKRFPPPSEVDVERGLHKLKVDLLRTYKNHKVEGANVTDEECEFIDDLARNDNIIVKPSDKCKGHFRQRGVQG